MSAQFDQYVQTYKDIINRGSAITGESFEYFIGVRLDLVLGDWQRAGRPSPGAILDFGCGIGATAPLMRERFPGASIVGVDESPASIRAAESLGVPGASFLVAPGVPLPLASESFDIVYSNGTFHHIDHAAHAAIFRELTRVLRPGGRLYVFENNPLNPVMVREMRLNPFDQDAKMLFPWYLQRQVREGGLRAASPRYYAFYPKQLKSLRWSEKYLRALPAGAQYYVRGEKVSRAA
jgi:SAM-dependent methyltransferase